jgi:PHD/YefM family antitoxin component YafN of YafNO toxin-antitoxin module
VHKNGNLKNGVRVQVDEFDLLMMMDAAEEFTSGNLKSTLEE